MIKKFKNYKKNIIKNCELENTWDQEKNRTLIIKIKFSAKNKPHLNKHQ